MTSRTSSYTLGNQTRDISPLNTTRVPSTASVSPSTTLCNTPKIFPQQSSQSMRRAHRPAPLTLDIPKSEGDLHADLHWQINARNPRNWRKLKKWIHTIIPSALAWVFALGSSIVTPAHDTIMDKLQTSSIVVVLTLALYILGLAFGPYLSSLGSEVFGRKSVYMICVPLYAIFMLASGLVQVLPGLLLCRFLAGVSASPALHMGWSTLGDLWIPDEKTIPLTIYVSSTFLGSTLGPVLGAYLVWEDSWRWTQYVVLCALGGCLLPVMLMHETSKKAILRRKLGQSARAPIDGYALSLVFGKPVRMLLTEPIVLLYALYAAFNFGVLYAIYTAFPAVLAQAEHFGRGHQGLSFLGMSVGVIMGLIVYFLYETFIYRSRVARYKEERATEEERTLQTGRRASRTNNRFSFIRPSPEQITMSKIVSPDSPRRSSILHTIRRLSAPGYKNLETSQPDPHRNLNLAVAAARYMNSIPANEGKHIVPERILLLLNQNLEFSHLCVALEGYKLKFNRVKLAKTLYDALQDHPEPKSLIISPTQHRLATEATLSSNPPLPLRRFSSPQLPRPNPEKRKTWIPPSNIPPPEWRLQPALPSSALIAASLFMLGWTAREGIHWIVPVIAMGIYSCSSLTTFLSTTLYSLECYGPTHGESAIGGSMMLVFLFGFAFPLFAQPMYLGLGPGLATSVFAFIAIVLGLVLSLLYVFGTALRRRQGYKERK